MNDIAKIVVVSAVVSVCVVIGGNFGTNKVDDRYDLLVARVGEDENKSFDDLQRIICLQSKIEHIIDFVGKDIIPQGWYTLMPRPKELTVKSRLDRIEARLDALEKGSSK